MPTIEYVSYEHQYSKQFQDISNYDYVQLPKHVRKGAKKILIVLDYMPTEDLQSGRMLSGATGQLFKRILKVANTYYREPNKLNDYDWLAVCHNAFKTAGQPESFRESAKDEFKRRLEKVITTYKPDIVLTFGNEPYRALNSARLAKYDNKLYHLFGVPTDITVTRKEKSHKCIHIPSISLNTLISDVGSGNSMSLAGYVSRNVVSALAGELKYKVPKLKYKPILIDSIEKFDRMMKEIKTKELLAIDTETENLNRRVNRMLTIQFAYSTDKAFVVPTYHKDSPFTSEELKYIQLKLQKFFEKTNQNKFHIFTNGKFDLTVIRNFCGVRFYKTNIWDIFAGEFLLDENMKALNNVIGNRYYSLLNLSMQYGCTAYYDAEFGKDKRKTIYAVDLDDALIEYCCLDVIVPLHIHRLQLRRAKDIGYVKFQDVVGYQLSDMSHNFSNWEFNGCPTDIEYLFSLKTKNSPIRLELERAKKALYESEGVKKANKLLSKRSGAPTVGLFGRSDLKLFDISKQDHQQVLFFDVLKLKPISKGKANSKGVVKNKIDKKFQSKYEDSIVEVKLYKALQKAKKLYNAYVKSLIKQWGIDEDMRFDSHIRPQFEFLDVVTGRTSAKKPSLQQIPSRDKAAEHIKRLFVAEKGRILIKVDYSAHEVRCLSLDSYVSTENGRIQLRSLLDMPIKPLVYSYNHDTLEVELKPVGTQSIHPPEEDMYEIEYEGGKITVTGNHQIWSVTRNSYVRADEIMEDEELLINGTP
jgi:DNA polymerase I-like protein with 3'-5' exonuclease and polymerase domains